MSMVKTVKSKSKKVISKHEKGQKLIMTVNHVYSRAYHAGRLTSGSKVVARRLAKKAVREWKSAMV